MTYVNGSALEAPRYFAIVQKRASELWKLLNERPDVAGPWHQLFNQVQSPRHVISELLQNADDAGATEASVDVQNGEFVFTHNGEDFTEEHFNSLCNFGYSNKRSLHTIGFRGIGFKSTFSLGSQVQLSTPTLSVVFNRDKFTLPVWSPAKPKAVTEIRVSIQDRHRQSELEKNLAEWLRSPVSLLFFHNLRGMRVGGQEVHWQSHGAGPLHGSEWMSLASTPEKKYLLIRSSEEEFPPDALEEIQQERMVLPPEEATFPPCRVEIVLGMEGRLFVILPTGVSTKLPFACNAPFIQDPARLKIKDPDISVTNRWLLSRAGALAASAMLAWVENDKLDVEQRVKAYELLPGVDGESQTLEGSCATIVKSNFEDFIKNSRFIITESKNLAAWDEAVAVPQILLQTWEYKDVSSLFASPDTPLLSHHISEKYVSKLINWGIVDSLTDFKVIEILGRASPPRPVTWRKLMEFWAYIYNVAKSQWPHRDLTDARVVPIRGQDTLYASGEVVRLGEKKLLNSAEDWNFLGKWLQVLHQNWPRFLTEQKRKAEERGDEVLGQKIEDAYRLLKDLKLADSDDVSEIMQKVSSSFFEQKSCKLQDCVRLTQIAAALGASIPNNFKFVTQDLHLRDAEQCVLVDFFKDIDIFVDEGWIRSHVLHPDYDALQSCTAEEWRNWIFSKRSTLSTFIPLEQVRRSVWGRSALKSELEKRGIQPGSYHYQYKTNEFIIVDWDFNEEHWSFWAERAEEDKFFWGILLSRVLKQFVSDGAKFASARVLQVATTGNTKSITWDSPLPGWIVRFRDLPCLQDNRGIYRYPSELLCRTPETECLLDVEPFVAAEFDTESFRPLLILLGVRDTPTGTERLLERVRALSMADEVPVYEVEKWYHRLDQLVDRCPTDELAALKKAFAHEKIILTENCGWGSAHEVFLSADETSVPGAALIHPAVTQLALWLKVGVSNYPTPELGMKWLRSLDSGKALSPDESRRVKALLQRYPQRIWEECRHWINLENEWVSIENLAYSLTMQSLVAWKHLFRPIKQKTADLQMLPYDVCEREPFVVLDVLAKSIEERFSDNFVALKNAITVPWMNALGSALSRVVFDDNEETKRVRGLGRRLTNTACQKASSLKTIPYISNTPAGTPRAINVLWKDFVLYLDGHSTAKLAKNIVQEIGRVFDRADITDAIKFCYERRPEFILDYLNDSFHLDPEVHYPERDMPDNKEQPDPSSLQKEPVLMDEPLSNSKEDPVSELLDTNSDALDVSQCMGTSFSLHNEDLSDEEHFSNKDGQIRRRATVTKPTLIELYALANGFQKEQTAEKFSRKDGGWIQSAPGSSFPWQEFSPSGDLLQCYWVKDICIKQDPLQVAAEIWELCIQDPEKHSFILARHDGTPIRYSGHRIRQLLESGKLKLFPATYRILYNR